MRTTVTLDDELLRAAGEYSGLTETADIVRLALRRFVEREAARRLALLGGSDPDATVPRRRRPDDDNDDQ